MNQAKALRLINEFHPKNPADFKELGLPLHFIGGGAFREVCQIDGLKLVVKFPLMDADGSHRSGKMHSTMEARKVAQLREYPELRSHLPVIYYHNPKTGVLVMKHYPKYTSAEDQIRHLGAVMWKLIWRVTGVNCSDISSKNFHRNGKRGVMVDLGY